MKHAAIGITLAAAALCARAEFPESDIRQFERGKTSYEEVITKLGPPTKTEYNDEGLRAIAYLNNDSRLNSASTASVIGTLAAMFIPGAAGLATSMGSVAVGTIGGGADGQSSITTFSFDKNGLLIYYRAAVTLATVGTFASKTNTKVISSEDGATPLPNITLALTDQQRSPPVTPPSDGKPRLGINYVPIGLLEEKAKAAFAAAKFNGLVITAVAPGSVAEKAGIREGDYLYILNGMLVDSIEEVVKAMSTVRMGDTIKAHARRIDPNARLYREQVFSLQF